MLVTGEKSASRGMMCGKAGLRPPERSRLMELQTDIQTLTKEGKSETSPRKARCEEKSTQKAHI